jgi:hypothetical protein
MLMLFFIVLPTAPHTAVQSYFGGKPCAAIRKIGTKIPLRKNPFRFDFSDRKSVRDIRQPNDV